jgi:hypothetical protein
MDSVISARISPEQEIVLHSIRVDHRMDDRIRELLHTQLNWFTLREFALRHQVLPLLYTRIKSLAEELILEQEMHKLRDLYLVNTQRNLRLTRMLLRVLDLFSEKGIECITLKGPVMAHQLYGDLSMRQVTDLDLLIHNRDYQRCSDVLMGADFLPVFVVSQKEQPWMLRAETELQFYYQDDILDIHWEISQRGVYYPLKTEQFWHRVQYLEKFGRTIPILSPENLFLLLCMHGAKHMWERLAWISDLAHFLNTFPELDWDSVLKQAEIKGFERVVYLGILLAEKIGGAHFPVSQTVRCRSDPIAQNLADDALNTIISNDPTHNEFYAINYYLRARERLTDRLYYIFDQTFVPKYVDWMTVSFPKMLYPAYYIYRPYRLLRKFSPHLLRLL